MEILKRDAVDAYKFEVLLWTIRNAFGGSSKPPRIPELLREKRFEVVSEPAAVAVGSEEEQS